jgi:hypothetical protein
MKKLFFLCASVFTLTLFYSSAHGQINSGQNNVDQVFDRFGNAYPIKDIQLATPAPQATMMRGSQTIDVQTCLAGDEFELYFERGSGFHTSDTDADFNNQTSGINPLENQQIACAVFSQLSAFINSQIDSTDSTRVRIWFRSMEEVLDLDDANLLDNEAQSLKALAFASSYYSLLFNGLSPGAEITDGLVWQTLNTGSDPYATIPLAFNFTGGNQSPYFHGFIAFNFFNPDIAPNWAHDMSGAGVGLNFDMFSILLHEATHTLGFNSLIASNGGSAFGLGFNYYSRMDRLIRDSTATDFLIQPMDSLCVMYNNIFAADSSVLTPDFEDPCPHNPTIMVWGEPIKLFSDSVFHPGGTVSHISRQCQQGAVACAANNSNFFVMDNSSDMAEIVRSYQETERNILCQLGYNLQPEFGDDSTSNHCSYDSICSPITVGGVNDGYLNGEYLYQLDSYSIFDGYGTFIAPSNIGEGTTAIYDNDPGAVGFICAQIVSGNGILLFDEPVNGVYHGILYNPTNGWGGIHTLSYIPVGPNGELGNITYIFIQVTASCPELGCTVISNGDFERSNISVSSLGESVGELSCWDRLYGNQLAVGEGPGFQNTCPDSCLTPVQSNLFDGGRTTGVCTYYHYPPCEVHPFSTDSATNILLLLADVDTATHQRKTSVLQNYLGSDLIPNQHYRLTFWAKVHNYGDSGTFTGSIPFKIGTMKYYISQPISGYAEIDPTISIPLAFPENTVWDMDTTFWIEDNIPQGSCLSGQGGGDLDWHPVTYEFTFGGTEPHGTLLIWIDPTEPTTEGQIINRMSNLFVDDMSIVPIATANIDLPENVCANQAPFLLQGTPSGGVFSGAGVTSQIVNGNTEYVFDRSLLPEGTTEAAVNYTVPTVFGCDSTIVTDVIHIINNPAPIITAQVLSNATCNTICNGEVDINVSSGTGDLTTTLIPDYTYNALCGDEFYLAIVTDSLECQDTVGFYISLLSQNCCALNIVFDSIHVSCDDFANGSASITATGGLGALSYLWTGPGASTTVEDPTGLMEGTWTITVTDSAGCAATDSILIQNISLSLVTDSLQAACAGSANGAAWISVSGGSAPYTYSWTGPGGATSSLEDPTGLVAGNWNVLVTDANGCERLAAIAVDTLVIDIVVDQVVKACPNSATGGAFVTISGGLEPYTYEWTLTGQPTLYSQDISGVEPGIWHLEVTDAMGCTNEIDVDILELNWDISLMTFINGNALWASTLYVNAEVKVANGATLNITDTDIFFGPAAKIIVYAGGKLIVRNSTLTHACGNGHWKGILVYGNQTGPAYVSNPTVANGRVEMYGASNNFPNGHSEVSYALRGCQIGENGFTNSNHRGGTCYIEGTTFLNNLKQDIDINEYNNVPRELVVTNCDFIVDNNFVLQMTDPKRYSLFLHKRVRKLRVNDCNWKYNYSGNNYRGMQNKNAIHGEGTALIDSCTFEGYWTAIMLTPPSGIPFLGTLVAIRNCDFASYNGIDLTGYSSNAIVIQNNVFRDIESVQNPILNAALTAPRNYNGNSPCDPPTILELNNGSDDTYYMPGYAMRLRSCSNYKVQENIIDQDFANLPTDHILPDRMGVYIDNCGGNTVPFSANRVDNCTAALIYRNDNRDYDADSTLFGAKFSCNEFNFNFDDVIIMSDDDDNTEDVQHGVHPQLGNSFESPKNPMHVDPIDPVGDIRVDDHIFQVLGLTGHNYYWNADALELDTALCNNLFMAEAQDYLTCSVLPPSGSNIVGVLLSDRNQLKSQITDLNIEINEIKDGGNTDYLSDQIVYTNYQNALQTYYSLIENSPNLSEEVLMLALDQYALPNPLLVEILSSNPQAAKSVDVMDKVNNRMIPFTEYQKQMIMNGMNLTSYLESLRFQKQQATGESRRLLYEITNLIIEDTTISDKKSELLNLYGDEWIPSDVIFKMSLHASDGNIGSAEDIIDQWPSNYNPSTQELQAMHDWVWIIAHSDLLNDDEVPLSAENEIYLQQICHSVISVVSDAALSILEKRGLQQVEELLGIPAKGVLRNSRISLGSMPLPKFSLYPNPSSQFTLLTCSEAMLKDLAVDVYDVTGREVFQGLWKMGNSQLLLNTENWNSGVYLIEILGVSKTKLMYVKQ